MKEKPKERKTFINFQILIENKDIRNKVKKKFGLDENKLIEIIEKINKFREKISKDEGLYDEFVKDINELRKKNPEVLKTFIYHLVIGSSFKLEEIERFDLEGEDSILNYIENKLK